MEAAASIITVITLSLQSTKFIYQSTKEIRDGPSVVTELAARTRRLEETLQQLQHLVQDSSQLTRVHDTSIWEPLVRHTSQCSDTLQEMARKFKALDSSGSKDRLKKTWKGIKISLKKEDLSRSSDQMQHHIDVLGLQIGIINSRLGISREARESQLLDTIQASLRDTNAQLSLQTIEHKTHVSEVMQGVESSLTELTTVLHDLGKGHETRSDQTNGAIQSVGRLVNDRLDENQGHLQQNAHEITDKIAARLDKLQNMSANQFQVIIDYLRQLETQGSSTSEPNSTNLADGQPLRRDEQAQTSAASHGGSKLSASINRLCLLASSKTQVCYLEDAEGIIDDLECILDAILHHEVQTTDKGLEGRKRKRSNEDQPQSIYRDIKRMRGLLFASHAIKLGECSSTRRGCIPKRRQKNPKHSGKVYTMADCEVLVSFTTDTCSEGERRGGFKTQSLRNIHNTSRGNISIIPSTDLKRFKISATFLQRPTSSGFNSLNPMLSFHPIVPGDAEIFEAVKTGNTDWMVELMTAGKASLQDCDADGRSLLNFAIAHQQLPSCRFLVAHGADVDSMEKSKYGYYAPPLKQGGFNDFEIEDDGKLYTWLAIRQCLLEYGADPLSLIHDSEDVNDTRSVFQDILEASPPDFFAITLRYGRDYIDLEAQDEHGRNWFLQYLRFLNTNLPRCESDGEEVAQKIKYLLSYSLNVGTRDSDGQGCLHTLLHLNRRTILERGAITHAHPTLFGVISLLIQTDADIYAVDDEGFSVTEFAHFNRMGHVWERALTRCGYDIQQVYNTDHNKGHEYSDDIYAPDHDQPRQVRAFCSNYYKAEGVEGLSGSDTPEPEKKIEWSYVNSMSEDEDAEEEEGKLDDDGKENDDNEKGQEEGTSHTTENYGQNSIEEHTETDTEQSLSDDEMGGVRVTGWTAYTSTH